ncbi:MAG: contact-dependent growth inhibition system immunity protein [Clostridia bacterium]|nr:contact-dependent growth inhibition system immunity protein [Clostridia bacterium]
MEEKTIKELFNREYDYCEHDLGEGLGRGLFPLQIWYNQLLDKKVSEINILDVLRMIRQNRFVEIAVDKAMKYLRIDPFYGEIRDGEIIYHLAELDMSYLSKYQNELKNILKKALADDLGFINRYGQPNEWDRKGLEEEKKELNEVIIKFLDKIHRYKESNSI